MNTHGTEIVPHLTGFYRFDADRVALDASGDGTLQFDAIRQGYVLMLDGVTIGGSSLGGARVNVYRGMVADDTYLGTVLLGATDPAAIFQPTSDVWLRGGEALVAEVVGAGASSDAIGSAWGRLYELEERPWGGSPAVQRVVVVGAELEPAGPPAIGEPEEGD